MGEYFIKIGGQNVSEAFYDDVEEVVVDNSLHLPDMFTIRLHDQKGVSPSRPRTRHDYPEQSVTLFQLRAVLLSLQHDELLTKGNILNRQIRDDIELSREPSAAVLDDFQHH